MFQLPAGVRTNTTTGTVALVANIKQRQAAPQDWDDSDRRLRGYGLRVRRAFYRRKPPKGTRNRQGVGANGFTSRAKESIVTKRVPLGELKFWYRNCQVNQLTHEAESECSRLFALKGGFPRVCDDSYRQPEISVPNGLLSGSGSNHGGWTSTPGATLSNSLSLSLTSVVP